MSTMLDDKSIISRAYQKAKSGNVETTKSKEVDIFDCHSPPASMKSDRDPIMDLAKYKKRESSFKRKAISSWVYVDFLRYFSSLLTMYGMTYERTSSQSDGASMGRLHDVLATHLKENMSNKVLKEYLEWWVHHHGEKYHDSELFIWSLYNGTTVDVFLKRFDCMQAEKDLLITSDLDHIEISDHDLYQLGGISLLLMKRGIVRAYRMAKDKKCIKAALGSFSKEVLKETMELTLDNSPYDEKDKVDFIELAQKSMVEHNMKEYLKFRHEQCFGKTPSQRAE